MGEYKTLYCLRSGVFWPKIIEDTKQWVAKFAHCIAYHIFRNRKSELYFSWPIKSPFWIIHTDLWSLGNAATNSRGNTGYHLKSLCDLTHHVVSTPTFDINTAALAKLFTGEVLLKFGTDRGSHDKFI